MEMVPHIKEAVRMTVWNPETKQLNQTMTMKIQWEGSRLPDSIDLGIQGRFYTKEFVQAPIRCYKYPRYNHTSNTCHAKQDMCGLCGEHHRTKVCVDKRNANETIKLKCHNCKGDHSTASVRCPYRREVILKMRPAQPTIQAEPVKSAWTRKPVIRQPTHTIHKQPNQFHMLQQLPSMDDFPDTLHTSGSTVNHIPVDRSSNQPAVPLSETVRLHHRPEPLTPQKKRFHSGDWKQVGRTIVNRQQQSLPAPRPQPRIHVTAHPEPQPSRQDQTVKHQAPLTGTITQDSQMTVKDIIATNQLIMTMQHQLMSQMSEIQPNQYILNIRRAILQSMSDITLKYELCIGMPKV